MGATILTLTSLPPKFQVTCEEHALRRVVPTYTHAENIRALHDRIDHAGEEEVPVTFDVSAAAAAVLEEARTPGQGSALEGALMVWQALTGAHPDPAALTLAERYAAEQTTAHPAPF